MTSLELNAQIWRDMAAIADSEPLMTKDEFFAKIERAEQQIERGEYSVLLPGEDLTTHLKRLGYDI